MPARIVVKAPRAPHAARDSISAGGEQISKRELEEAEVPPGTPTDALVAADAVENGKEEAEAAAVSTPAAKKKKKKKAKKKGVGENVNGKTTTEGVNASTGNAKPGGLCIARNKHWKYISSYHVRIYCSQFSSPSYGDSTFALLSIRRQRYRCTS